jgi:hypothetical protein
MAEQFLLVEGPPRENMAGDTVAAVWVRDGQLQREVADTAPSHHRFHRHRHRQSQSHHQRSVSLVIVMVVVVVVVVVERGEADSGSSLWRLEQHGPKVNGLSESAPVPDARCCSAI